MAHAKKAQSLKWSPVLPDSIINNPPALIGEPDLAKNYWEKVGDLRPLFDEYLGAKGATLTRQVHVVPAVWDGRKFSIVWNASVEGTAGPEVARKLNLVDEGGQIVPITAAWTPKSGAQMIAVIYVTLPKGGSSDDIRATEVVTGYALPFELKAAVASGELKRDIKNRPSGKPDLLTDHFKIAQRLRFCAMVVKSVRKIGGGRSVQYTLEPHSESGLRIFKYCLTDAMRPGSLDIGQEVMCFLAERPNKIVAKPQVGMAVTFEYQKRDAALKQGAVEVEEVKPPLFRVGGIVFNAFTVLRIRERDLSDSKLGMIVNARYDTSRVNKRHNVYKGIKKAMSALGRTDSDVDAFARDHHVEVREAAIQTLRVVLDARSEEPVYQTGAPRPKNRRTRREIEAGEAPGEELVPPAADSILNESSETGDVEQDESVPAVEASDDAQDAAVNP